MKKFIEERKRLTMKHYRQMEQLKKLHQEQLEKFAKDSSKVGHHKSSNSASGPVSEASMFLVRPGKLLKRQAQQAEIQKAMFIVRRTKLKAMLPLSNKGHLYK